MPRRKQARRRLSERSFGFYPKSEFGRGELISPPISEFGFYFSSPVLILASRV